MPAPTELSIRILKIKKGPIEDTKEYKYLGDVIEKARRSQSKISIIESIEVNRRSID